MQYQFETNDMVLCRTHPHKPVKYIYCNQDQNPYPSRLICQICSSEKKSNDGFLKIEDVLRDPKIIMDSMNESEKGIYNQLNDYFNLLDRNPDEILKDFKDGIVRLIEDIKQKLNKVIETFKQFQAKIAEVKHQFDEALGFTQFKQAFKDILTITGYHYGPEWGNLEKTIQNFMKQFKDQNNQELIIAYHNIRELEGMFDSLDKKNYDDFEKNTSESIKLLKSHLQNMGILQKNQYTQLCEEEYFFELLQRIRNNQNVQNVQPKITLLFKASKHGMNAQAFWGKCSNYGPTLTICKSKNGYVFGGYTPCKWIPNGDYQKDESKTSFLFSYTRKEVYPIQDVNYAIYCTSDYGPTFGGHPNLYIAADFQYGYSLLDNTYYQDQQYEIENSSTHLMGSETPQLVEMEVFLIKWE